jgi:hypothetical protein
MPWEIHRKNWQVYCFFFKKNSHCVLVRYAGDLPILLVRYMRKNFPSLRGNIFFFVWGDVFRKAPPLAPLAASTVGLDR